MADKKFLNERLGEEELDKVTGGTNGCEMPAPDDIHDEQPPEPNPVTPPYIPPMEPGGEVPVVEPPMYMRKRK